MESLGSAVDKKERIFPWLEGLFLGLLVLLLVAAGGETVRASYHGLLHSRVGDAVWQQGLMPENPYHAGAALRYYTLYPALGVGLGRLGFGPLWGFALLNGLAAILYAPALDALGRSFQLKFRARRFAFWASVLGFNAFGWFGLFFADSAELGQAPVFVLKALCWSGSPFYWDARLQAFLPKFLNVSSFALALAPALWAMAAATTRPVGGKELSWVQVLAAGFSLGLALALNPLAGGFAALCMASWKLPVLWQKGPARWQWPAAAILAGLVAFPFLVPAFAKAERSESWIGPLAVAGQAWSNGLGPLLLLLPLGILGWRKMEKETRLAWTFAAGLAALLLMFIPLPWGNEYKMARLGAVLWALPAGVCLQGLAARKPILAWALLALAAPTSIWTATAYAAWGNQEVRLPLRWAQGEWRIASERIANPIPEALLQAAENAPAEAVLLMHPAQPGSRVSGGLVQGNALAPSFRQSLFVDLPQIHNDRQEDLADRLDLLFGLYAGQSYGLSGPKKPLAEATALERVRAKFSDRPLLVLSHQQLQALEQALTAAGGESLANESGFSFWLLPPP